MPVHGGLSLALKVGLRNRVLDLSLLCAISASMARQIMVQGRRHGFGAD
jgi:hypothetical protein